MTKSKITSGFNPTLVRLRQPASHRNSCHYSWFQSHAGSIEAPTIARTASIEVLSFNPTLVRLRRYPCESRNADRQSFNPTLVRLRPCSRDPCAYLRCGFNPTLVRLRRPSTNRSLDAVQSFNPTLVRLRRPRGLRPRTPTAVFQSHAGSIEAWRSLGASRPGSWVSIPRWFD